MFKYKKTVLSLAILSALSLTGCGGGGSGSAEGDGGVSGVTTSGVVAKGIINDGIVTAVELGSDPSAEGVEVGSAVTEEDGTYELAISDDYTGGPIQLTITTDADSQVKCDTSAGCGPRGDDITDTDTTIDFGEWYKPGADAITMRAMIAGAAEGATVSAQITPFTEMAASRALAATTFDSDAIANANSEVSSLLKVNILSTAPVDITDLSEDASATEIAYAALSASVANLAAKDEAGTPDIQAAITALSAAFEGGAIAATDDDDAAISLQDLIDGVDEALESAGVEDTSGVVAELKNDVSSADENGEVNPEPVDTAVLANVDKAKAFVEEFRTYINTLDTEVNDPEFGGEFESQLTLVSDTLDAATSDNNPIMAAGEAISVADEFLYYALDDDGEAVQLDDTEVTFTESDDFPFTSGTLTYSKENNSVEIENGKIGDNTVNLTIAASEVGTENGDVFEASETYSVTGSVVSDSDLQSLVITQGSYAEDYQEEEVDVSDEENGVYSYSNSYFFDADIDLEVTYTFKDSAEATPVMFVGEMSTEVFGKDFYEDTYDESGFSSNDSEVTFFKNLTLDGELTSGEDNVNVALVVSQPNAEEFYNAETFTETAENYLQANVGVTLEAGVDTLEPVTLNVSAVRTAIDEAEFEMTLSQDDRVLTVSFANDINSTEPSTDFEYALNLELGDVKDGEITVTNLDGVELTLTPNESEEIGVVTIDGEEVATIEETEDGVIKTTYSDGTFELY